MKEAKHTPGPWGFECGDDPSDWSGYFPVVFAENYCVVGREGMYGYRSTDIANARLIAAAPELLEALKDVMSAVELGWIPDGESMFNAREAIAKATGEQL